MAIPLHFVITGCICVCVCVCVCVWGGGGWGEGYVSARLCVCVGGGAVGGVGHHLCQVIIILVRNICQDPNNT